jgi:hypothetical protein
MDRILDLGGSVEEVEVLADMIGVRAELVASALVQYFEGGQLMTPEECELIIDKVLRTYDD